MGARLHVEQHLAQPVGQGGGGREPRGAGDGDGPAAEHEGGHARLAGDVVGLGEFAEPGEEVPAAGALAVQRRLTERHARVGLRGLPHPHQRQQAAVREETRRHGLLPVVTADDGGERVVGGPPGPQPRERVRHRDAVQAARVGQLVAEHRGPAPLVAFEAALGAPRQSPRVELAGGVPGQRRQRRPVAGLCLVEAEADGAQVRAPGHDGACDVQR